MSTTAAAHPRLRRPPGTQIPRRRSGRGGWGTVSKQGSAPAQQRTLAHALLAGARRLGDARMLDRLVRGRVWLGIVAVALLGIVFMQVSLLRLNASVGVAVTKADTLERENSGLRGDISKLDSGERIQNVAAKLGMVMPPAGDVHFLDARGANARLASTSITAPKAVQNTVAPAPAAATTAAPAPTAVAPVTPAAATPAPAPVTATPAQTAPPVTQQAQTPAPATSTPPLTQQPAPAAATAGGAAAPTTGAR